MTRSEKADLQKLSPEELLGGFVREAKLNDPAMSTTVREMNDHGAASRAYAEAIVSRGGLASLLPLIDLHDDWVAYSAAAQLVRHDETKDRALRALDRIADACSGSASGFADRARNMIRFGDPFGPPSADTRVEDIPGRPM